MTKGSRLFCARPFEWLEVSHVRRRGELFMCCPSWLDTPIGNLRRDPVETIWNGAAAREIRRSILDGTFAHCNASLCPFLRTRSGPVRPAAEVDDERLRSVLAGALTVLPWGPKKVSCSYDRSCNLSCPSCREETIVEVDARDELLEVQQVVERQALPGAEYLYITGSGDAFGSPMFRRWLRTMDTRRMPRLRSIHLHTNALLWDERMWQTLPPRTRSLIRSAEISIDAASAATYAVNRRGGSFPRLLRNLAFIARLRAAGPLAFLKISMVVQANNLDEMPAFVQLGRRVGADVVYFSQLVNWGTFSDREFRDRAVHLPSHPRHRELLELLASPELTDPRVDTGNLTAPPAPSPGAGAPRPPAREAPGPPAPGPQPCPGA